MKKIITIIFLTLVSLSCSDSINDLLDMVEAEVPICVINGYVAANPDGRGWKNAVGNIQTAVNLVQSGGEIWVKADTYNISSTITIDKSVSIYGGFNGTEQKREHRSSDNTITTLTGGGTPPITFNSSSAGKQILLDCFRITGYPIQITGAEVSPVINNCRFENIILSVDGAALQINTNASATISNSIFYNCRANAGNDGGAIYVNNSTLTLSNTYFIGNYANNFGGAIYATGSSTTLRIINNCIFIKNEALINGGAIYTSPSFPGTVNIYISDSTFGDKNNIANANYTSGGGGGGAIYLNSSDITCLTSATIINSIISNNNATGSQGGGLLCYGLGASLNITNCEISSNTSGSQGGAILISRATAQISNSTFNGNSSLDGGAIYIINGSPTVNISNSNFTTNAASGTLEANDGGGAICIPASTTANVTINNSQFISNTVAGYTGDPLSGGGAIYCGSGQLSVNRCKFKSNTVTNGGGGAIYLASSTATTIMNSLFYDNYTHHSNTISRGGAICIHNTSSISNVLVNLSFYYNRAFDMSNGGAVYLGVVNTIYNSVFYLNESNTTDEDNVSRQNMSILQNCFFYGEVTDPTERIPGCITSDSSSPFIGIDPGNENTFLYPKSNIIDKGINSAPWLTATDLAGNPRIVGGTVDIGAYEAQ